MPAACDNMDSRGQTRHRQRPGPRLGAPPAAVRQWAAQLGETGMMKPLVNREEPLKTGLRNYWYPLARAADLTSKPRRALALGEELVLWRDSRGRAHIMRDRCPHR